MEESERPTLAQVFGRFYPRYRQRQEATAEQRKAAWCIRACRTPAMGGSEYVCEHCQQSHRFYHSCRNRHCPVCQGAQSRAWLERQEERLLPVPYFHVVFTIPSELHGVFAYNRARLYDLLFRTSAGTLQSFAADPRWLGGQLGMLGILHTWGQTLAFHPHVHYIVAQGGLDRQGRWVSPRQGREGRFLFPMKAVSQVFQGRLLAALERMYRAGQLRFADILVETRFADTLRIAASKRWEVYAQRPFAGPETLLRYLSLYTHRTAISNGRLLGWDQRQVSFAYKDYRNQGRPARMTLRGEEFIGRFLQHVLPQGFRRIRAYGFLANGAGLARLQAAQLAWLSWWGIGLIALRQWLEEQEAQAQERAQQERTRCPNCQQGPLHRVRALHRLPLEDSS